MVAAGVLGIDRGEGLGHDLWQQTPGSGIEPDVRIGNLAGGEQQPIGRQPVGDRHHRHLIGHPFEQCRQPPFEMEPRGHHKIGLEQPVGIAGRRLIGVGIDARGHQAVNHHPLAPHLTHEVSDDRGRRHDGDGFRSGHRLRPTAAGEHQPDCRHDQRGKHKARPAGQQIWAPKNIFLKDQNIENTRWKQPSTASPGSPLFLGNPPAR